MSDVFLWCDCAYARLGLMSLLDEHLGCSPVLTKEQLTLIKTGCYLFYVTRSTLFDMALFANENRKMLRNKRVIVIPTSAVAGMCRKLFAFPHECIETVEQLVEALASSTDNRKLTERHPNPASLMELRVMRLLMRGRSQLEVASILSLSEKTISAHKLKLLTKLGVKRNLASMHGSLTHSLSRHH